MSRSLSYEGITDRIDIIHRKINHKRTLEPVLHDATNTFQRLTFDGLSHSVAVVQIYERQMASVERSPFDDNLIAI